MSFRIRVAENIGERSRTIFGGKGTEHSVEDGHFFSVNGDGWSNDGRGFDNIGEINQYFNISDSHQTKFELIQEKVYTDFRMRVVENIGRISKREFGKVGTEYQIQHGVFTGADEYKWGNGGDGYASVEEVNDHFGDNDMHKTVFELIEDTKKEESNGNFTMQVVKNTGSRSGRTFGAKGTKHHVKRGKLVDNQGYIWGEERSLLNIEDVNYIFGRRYSFETVFELVEEDVSNIIGKSSLKHLCIVETRDGRIFTYKESNLYGVNTMAFHSIDRAMIIRLSEYTSELEHRAFGGRDIVRIYSPLEIIAEKNIAHEVERLSEEIGATNMSDEDIRQNLKRIVRDY